MVKAKSLFGILVAVAAVMLAAGVFGTAFAGGKGAKLPANGGEPGRDYMKYVKAVEKRDGATIRKMAEVGQVSDKEFKEQMEMAAMLTPSNQRIISGTADEDTAVLKVTGTLEGKKQYGTVQMQKKDGVWKITKEDWSEERK